MPRSHPDAAGLEFLANHIKQATFIYEVAAKHFTFLNPAFRQAFNMTKGTAIKAGSLLKMIHPQDRQYVLETYQKLLKGGNSLEIEFRIKLPGHEECWICLTHFLLGDLPGKQRIIGYVEDITTSKQFIVLPVCRTTSYCF